MSSQRQVDSKSAYILNSYLGNTYLKILMEMYRTNDPEEGMECPSQ
jgi:hypothetical protein